MPPLSTFDNNADVISWEPEHSHPPTPNTTKAPFSPKPRRTVAFSQTVSARTTLHVNNYTDDEIDACWYDDCEKEMMRKEVRSVVTLLKNGMLEQDTEQYCRRGGLECHTQEVALQRLKNRTAVLEAVLEEQEFQREEGIWEPWYIARAYKAASPTSQANAHAIALKDQLDAML
jgi:hypothetical protein